MKAIATTKNIFFVAFFIYVSVNILFSLSYFFHSFPNNYTWTELCINYQGGFIRRGLLGEFLFRFAKIIDIRTAICIVFFPLYLAYLFISLFLLKKSIDFTSCIIVVVCPSLLFFFVFDKEIIFRKDIFYELGFLVQFVLLTSKKISFRFSFFLVLFIYTVCLLIHESTIFYSAACFTLLIEKSYKNKAFAINITIIFVILFFSFLYLLMFSGNTIQKVSIFNSWRPLLTMQYTGALDYIGKSIFFQINQVFNTVSLKLFISIVFAISITSIPLLKICNDYNIFSRFNSFFTFLLNKYAIALSFFIPWFLPFVANDFGRHIHTAFLNHIYFLCSVIILTNCQNKFNTIKVRHSATKKSFVLWIVAFSFGWKLWHYPVKNQIITLSDPVRIFISETLGM